MSIIDAVIKLDVGAISLLLGQISICLGQEKKEVLWKRVSWRSLKNGWKKVPWGC